MIPFSKKKTDQKISENLFYLIIFAESQTLEFEMKYKKRAK